MPVSEKPTPNSEEVVQIGDETFIVDKDAPGDEEEAYAYLPDSKEATEVHMEDRDGIVADPHVQNWQKSTRPIADQPTGKKYAGVELPGTMRLCKRPRCGQIVPPSGNKGAKKLYHTPECARKHHRALSNKRRRKGGWVLEVDERSKIPVHFNRIKAPTEEIAEHATQTHTEPGICPLPKILETEEWGDRCPGRFNRYSCTHPVNCGCKDKAPRCLAYATLVDDMKEHWARRRGEVYIRQFTTNDGMWIDMSEIAAHMEPSKGLISGTVDPD